SGRGQRSTGETGAVHKSGRATRNVEKARGISTWRLSQGERDVRGLSRRKTRQRASVGVRERWNHKTGHRTVLAIATSSLDHVSGVQESPAVGRHHAGDGQHLTANRTAGERYVASCADRT